jgi:hypothetical protein
MSFLSSVYSSSVASEPSGPTPIGIRPAYPASFRSSAFPTCRRQLLAINSYPCPPLPSVSVCISTPPPSLLPASAAASPPTRGLNLAEQMATAMASGVMRDMPVFQ